jgi:hypothetical protein
MEKIVVENGKINKQKLKFLLSNVIISFSHNYIDNSNGNIDNNIDNNNTNSNTNSNNNSTMALTPAELRKACKIALAALTNCVERAPYKKRDAVKQTDYDTAKAHIQQHLMSFAGCLTCVHGNFIVVDGANMFFEAKDQATSVVELLGSVHRESFGIYDNIVVVIPSNHGKAGAFKGVAREVFENGSWTSSATPWSNIIVVLSPPQAKTASGAFVPSEVDDLITYAIHQFLLACGLQCVIVTKDLMRWVRDGATPHIFMEIDSEKKDNDVVMTV